MNITPPGSTPGGFHLLIFKGGANQAGAAATYPPDSSSFCR
jgi:hypothetical protein